MSSCFTAFIACLYMSKKPLQGTLAECLITNTSPKLVDPMLVLNVQCGPGAYDPNVEPAEVDILFEDETHFLQVAKNLFRLACRDLESDSHELRQRVPYLRQSGFDLLLSRRSKSDGGYVDVKIACEDAFIEPPLRV